MEARRTLRLIAILLPALSFPARAGVDVGFDPSVDFSRFRSFAWKEGGWQAPNLMTEKRIHMAVEQELTAKGVTRADENSDLLVVSYASGSSSERVDAMTYGMVPNSWTGWISAGTTSRGSYKGSLVVDLIDRQTNQIVWRGAAHGNLGVDPNPEKTGKKVLKLVKEMFQKYPPEVKK
jgi:hypothetical protein